MGNSKIESIFKLASQGREAARVKDIHEFFESSESSLRTKTIADVVEALDDTHAMADSEKQRMIYIIAIALLPDTISIIKNCIGIPSSRLEYECNFTLFCFLDEMQMISLDLEIKGDMIVEIRDYLLNVRAKTAHAAWLAGNFLGNHWMTNEAGKALLDVLQSARFSAGRLAAVSGLEYTLKECNVEFRDRLAAGLREVVKTDRSEIVRIMAESLKEKIG